MTDAATRIFVATDQLQQVILDLKSVLQPPDCCSDACARLKAENARLLSLLRQAPPPRPQMLPQRRLRLAAQQEWRCGSCQQILTEAFHADHIRPWAESFDDSDENISISCIPCHLAKTSEENSVRNRRKS